MQALTSSRDAVAIASTKLRELHTTFADSVLKLPSPPPHAAPPPRIISPLSSYRSPPALDHISLASPVLLHSPLRSRSASPHPSQSSSDAQFNKADLNGDGVIDRAEFTLFQNSQSASMTKPMQVPSAAAVQDGAPRSPPESLDCQQTSWNSSSGKGTAKKDWTDSLYF